jgi:hypothetical protein
MAALTFLGAAGTLGGLRHPREAGRERLMVNGERCQRQTDLPFCFKRGFLLISLARGQSDTPRKAGGLMSRGPSNGVRSLAKASRRARLLFNAQNFPRCSIRFLLLADGAANFVEFEPDRGNGLSTSPQVLAREISFPAMQSGHHDGALPFQKPDPRCHRMLGGNRDAHGPV